MGGHLSRTTKGKEAPCETENPRLRPLPQDSISNNKLLVEAFPKDNVTSDPSHQQLSGLPSMATYVTCIMRVQRAIRRRLCVKRFMRQHEWVIFNELDLLNEADGLELAHFMQALLELVPGEAPTSEAALDSSPCRLLLEETSADMDHVFFQSSLSSPVAEVELTITGTICPQQIIDVCRRGGRLSMPSIHKLMRNAYRLLIKMPNINRVQLPQNSTITIVGDIHGQLSDLLHIIDLCGMPSASTKYVFNGDWVDRGSNSIEVITVILALFVAHPLDVFLNRGNHEDQYVSRVYGFEAECDAKYPHVHPADPPNSQGFTFKMFGELFKHLPIASLINDEVFILHGGLFDSEGVTLKDLDELKRADYFCRGSVAPSPVNQSSTRQHYLSELMRQALWSDPSAHITGTAPNPRGSGILFGADVALKFMQSNKLSMVVRSHECQDSGIDFPFLEDCEVRRGEGGKTVVELGQMGPRSALLATIFSASDYLGGQNEGAFISLMAHSFADATAIPGAKGLHFSVNRYQLGGEKELTSLITRNRTSLGECLFKHKFALNRQFQAHDVARSGTLERLEFATILGAVTTIRIRWLAILSQLVPKHCLAPDGRSVLYELFLDSLRIEPGKVVGGDARDGGMGGSTQLHSPELVERLYVSRKRLEIIFRCFDANGDGKISKIELQNGCTKLASSLSPDSPHLAHLQECAHLFKRMDVDHSGFVDVNEFFETFRCLRLDEG